MRKSEAKIINGSLFSIEMKFTGNTEELLHLEILDKQNCNILKTPIESGLTALWFMEAPSNKFNIDGVDHTFHKNEIVFLTEFHKVAVNSIQKARFIRFNRPFYCILDHDNEVGCKGILFFGASLLIIFFCALLARAMTALRRGFL
jgi:AraC family transcriptional activator of pobA